MQFTSTQTNKPQTASFYKDVRYSDDSVVIRSVLESSFGKEIRIVFKEGQVMKEHKTKFPITVMTLKGSIAFSVGDEEYILNDGDIIALEGNVMHELKATKDSIVWLSLHKGDSAERVKSMITTSQTSS